MEDCCSPDCERKINTDAPGEYWFVLSCSHNVCVPCFSYLSAERGCSPYIKCPVESCGCRVTEWNSFCCEHTVTRNQTLRRKNPLITKNEIRKPELKTEPIQYHESMDDDDFENTYVLSLSCPLNSRGARGFVFAAELRGDVPEEWDEKNKDSIEGIFKIFHSFFVTNASSNEDLGYASAVEEGIDCIAESKKSMLHRCMHALSIGETIKEQKSDTARYVM
jgi:hypothetical protein